MFYVIKYYFTSSLGFGQPKRFHSFGVMLVIFNLYAYNTRPGIHYATKAIRISYYFWQWNFSAAHFKFFMQDQLGQKLFSFVMTTTVFKTNALT